MILPSNFNEKRMEPSIYQTYYKPRGPCVPLLLTWGENHLANLDQITFELLKSQNDKTIKINISDPITQKQSPKVPVDRSCHADS